MSSYQGKFIVVNSTGSTITNVAACHTASGQATSTIVTASLANGETLSGGVVNSQTSSHDYWTVSFVNSGNQLMTGYEQYAFHENDGGGTVSLVLNTSTFDINLPSGGSSTGNDYDQT